MLDFDFVVHPFLLSHFKDKFRPLFVQKNGLDLPSTFPVAWLV